ncbi:methyltransferase family protein [Tamaricihabitans halophyticus]|uniref:Methyltransferase family protein n=2 Tax=Tamaricihabitans halophyticus TaxID=1262583 RepID=A0A4R2Q482_9PSEU|nr:methyltransferase family protein [Tamaricihabitans halophyticus]
MPHAELYDDIGVGYAIGRRTDPRWMAAINDALCDADSVINVGAGTGSYEPAGRTVLAIEPAREMIRQRAADTCLAVRGRAEALPLGNDASDAALAVLTVHHWSDWRRGLAELRRIAARQVVLAYDTRRHADFWFVREYVPEIAELERGRPSATDIADVLGADSVTPVPVPWDHNDGVFPAYWRRPAAYLDDRVRRSCSALAQTDPQAVERGLRRLRADLDSGRWYDRHRALFALDEWDAGFRLIVAGR